MSFETSTNETLAQSPQTQMVEQQVRAWEVLDTDVLETMQNIPRENFFPDRLKAFAHTDSSFTIDNGFLIPSPSVQGKVLQALSLDPIDTILQIGAGSGYLTACLAELGSHVCTMDAENTFLDQIKSTCSELKITNLDVVQQEWKTLLSTIENTYDAIVSQHAFASFPDEIKNALNVDGVAVCFVGTAPLISCIRVERISEEEWVTESLFETNVSSFPTNSKVKSAFSF